LDRRVIDRRDLERGADLSGGDGDGVKDLRVVEAVARAATDGEVNVQRLGRVFARAGEGEESRVARFRCGRIGRDDAYRRERLIDGVDLEEGDLVVVRAGTVGDRQPAVGDRDGLRAFDEAIGAGRRT